MSSPSSPAPTQAAALQNLVRPPAARGAEQPTVLIGSALQLNRAQEQAMLAHFTRRKSELKTELGYMNYSAPGWVDQARSMANQHASMGYGLPFMAKRHIAHLIYQGEFDWRPALYGGLWQKSNIHLPVVRRFTQQQAARTAAYFFGTSPYFSADPVGQQDASLAKVLSRWAQFEAGEAQVDSTGSEAVQQIFIQGECVIKPIHETQVQFYKAFLEVAVDAAGKPLITEGNDYLFPSDTWVEIAHPLTGQPVTVLARDGRTPKPTVAYAFKRLLVDRKLEQYSGARLLNVDFQAFLAPLTAPTLQKADTVIHLYAEQLISLIARLAPLDLGTGVDPKVMLDRVARLVYEFTGSMSSQDGVNPSARPRNELGEGDGMLGNDRSEPGITIAEVWGWYDVYQNGTPRYVCVLMDDASNRPLYYDFAANVARFSKGECPFRAPRINPVQGRWHGRGQVELFYKLQHTMDLMLNRWNFSQTKAGRIDVVNRNAFHELADDATLPINGGMTLSMKDGFTKETALWSYYLSETKGADLQAILQLLMQVATNMSGVANANDSQAAGLETSELATGVKNIEQSGQELSGTWIQQIAPEMRTAMQWFLKLSAETLQTERAFTYFEGENQIAATVTPDQVRDLELHVDMNLTRYHAQQVSAQKGEAYAIVKSFYMELPPEVQMQMQTFVRNWLKEGFQIADADEIINAMMPPPVAPGGMPVDPNAPPAVAAQSTAPAASSNGTDPAAALQPPV